MKLQPFKLERYFARYDFSAKYLLSSSDCDGLIQSELLKLADPETKSLWRYLRLGYTESLGHPILRQEVASLYAHIDPDDVIIIVPEEGILIALNTTLRPGDHVICTFPGYQSLGPEGHGAFPEALGRQGGPEDRVQVRRKIGDAAVPYQLRRSRRRRTLGLTVTPREVRIHAPSWTPRAEIEHYVLQQHGWLSRAWARMQARTPKAINTPANEVRYLGRVLQLDIRPSLFGDVRRHGNTLRVHAPHDAEAQSLVRSWLHAQAMRLLAWRLSRIPQAGARTQPLCPVQRADAMPSQSWIVQSYDPLARKRPSDDQATLVTLLSWFSRVFKSLPLFASHTRIVLSSDPLARKRSSGDQAILRNLSASSAELRRSCMIGGRRSLI